MHQSCHGLRGLKLGTSSESVAKRNSKVLQLLQKVEGIELIDLEREDECCGFGGTFSVFEPDVSVKMGKEQLLKKIRKGKPEAKAHPGVFNTEKPDSMAQLVEDFSKQAGRVGAEVTEVGNKRDIEQYLAEKSPQANRRYLVTIRLNKTSIFFTILLAIFMWGSDIRTIFRVNSSFYPSIEQNNYIFIQHQTIKSQFFNNYFMDIHLPQWRW